MFNNNNQRSKNNLFLRVSLAFVLIFLSHLCFHFLLPEQIPGLSGLTSEVLESLLASFVAMPCLWWFVFKPILVEPLLTKAQKKLEKSETRFRNLTDHAPVGIFETDAQGGYIFVNQKWCEIMELSSDQALGTGWLSVLQQEEKQHVAEEWHRAVMKGGEFRLEYRVSNADNSEKWVYATATPLKGEDGALCNLMGIVTDVTERYLAEAALRDSEARFRALFEHSEDAILLLVPGTCTVIDVNGTAERMCGYTKYEMLGHDFNLLKPEAGCDDCMLSVCKLNGSETRNIEHAVLLMKGGGEIHVSVRAKLIMLLGEEAIFCTLRDISLRLSIEEEARAMQARMIHSNKMTSLGLLVAGIAHEINNPNNFIMVNAEMLKRIGADLAPILKEEEQRKGDFILGGLPYSQLEESLPEMISAIDEGSRRIKNIIGALKDHSRMGESAMDPLEINRVVDAAMLLLRHHVKKYTGNFVLELGEGIPRIMGSSQQLEQVIINLAMNALQSLTDRNQRLSLKTSYLAEKRAVLVTVTDEGCGIPDEVKNRIMEPFFTTRFDSGGTGLGLSITRSIVLAHQGTIDVSSHAGEGTVVTVSLPVAEEYQKGDSRNE